MVAKLDHIRSLTFIALLCSILSLSNLYAQEKIVPFSEENWSFFGSEVIDYLGRQSLKGSAQLKNVEFENGIIEFDIAVNGERSYPGIFFRVQSRSDFEHFYIRPHRAHYYPDALQYTPSFKNVDGWQLYNGNGYTAGSEIPRNEWVKIRLEVKGIQMKVFVNNSEEPSLYIDDLKHGASKGMLTLNSPNDGSAYFSNFKYSLTDDLDFAPPEKEISPIGIITDWEISGSYNYGKINLEKTPATQGFNDIQWQKVSSEPSGLVNVSRFLPRLSYEPVVVFAKTIIHSDKAEVKEIRFGYSDVISVFINGELIYSGSNQYRERDPSALGIIGLLDTVYPKFREGPNELLFTVVEGNHGWGFMAQDGKAVYIDEKLDKLWESEKSFTTSESVLYDPKREILYISNFDQYNVNNPRAQQHISKVTLDGKIEELKWVDNLNNPLGMTIYNDRLFVAERRNIAEINLDDGNVVNRYPIEGSIFLNDITIDDSGSIYITDSRKNAIWKYSNGEAEEWLSGDEVADPNTIYFHNGRIIFGNSDDQSLKAVDINTKEVTVIAKLDPGFIDGIRLDNEGNFLVSLWHGILYRITPAGEVTKILDTTTPGNYIADFEYIKEKNLLIIPTFLGNRIVAYKLN